MYFYKANALGLGGQVIRPQSEIIQSQAAVCLPSIGGHGFNRVEGFRRDGLVSFDAAYSEVGGSFDECHNVYTTYSHSVVEKLNVADVVTVDRVVCRTVSYAPPTDESYSEPSFDITGSYFENLRIAGHKIDLRLATHKLHEYDTYKKLSRALHNGAVEFMPWGHLDDREIHQLEELEDDYRGLRGLAGLAKPWKKEKKPRPFGHETYWLSAAGHYDLKKQFSDTELLGFGGIICIPKFGCIFLAELLVGPSSRRLNMLRIEFGSTHDGSLIASNSETGGEYLPSHEIASRGAKSKRGYTAEAQKKEDREDVNSLASRLATEAEEELLRAHSVKADRDTLELEDLHLENVIQKVESVLETSLKPHSLRDVRSLQPHVDVLASAKAGIDQAELRRLRARLRLLTAPRFSGFPASEQEQRVINLSFLGSKGIIQPDETLQIGRRYNLRVQIGPRLAESIVRKPKEIPEQQLRPFMRPEGIPLRVIVSSRDFELLDDDLTLSLPLAGPSQVIEFRLRTPITPQHARLRVVVYFEGNALQSLLVTARITESVLYEEAVGNKGEVEYCLCGTMNQVEMYPPRTLNILTNESSDGTHTFSVVGTDVKANYTFTEGEISTALRNARLSMLKACSELDKEGKPIRYLYDDDTNTGTLEQFSADLIELASAGSDLYFDILLQKDQNFQASLESALKGNATIQITSVKSAKYVFPWALVYDKKFREGKNNRICDVFLKTLKDVRQLPSSEYTRAYAMMTTQMCLCIGCPYKEDMEVICPSSFWGFRHLIEQPPSIIGSDQQDVPPRDTELVISVAKKPTMVMGVSLNLTYPDAHYKQIDELQHYAIELRQDKEKILVQMGAVPDPNVVYFYCHGGKDNKKRSFLSVGDQERIWPKDLNAYSIAWNNSHPLVFINGCRTVELTPDDLLGFVDSFMWCHASGVIGTEISIPESLAREFALEFFRGFADREYSVAEAIRRAKFLLLSKYNPLGLVYTPYCHGALKLEFPAIIPIVTTGT